MDPNLPPLIRDLLDPARYPHRPESVHLVQTHASFVLLAGPYVYKIKKPVNFGFLDYSTAERRRHFCAEEVQLNRRTSSGVYLDVVDISETPGGFMPEDSSSPVEAAVKMAHLPEGATLHSLIRSTRADETMLRRVARHIASFHRSAGSNDEIARCGNPALLRHHSLENFEQMRRHVGTVIDPRPFGRLEDWTRQFLDSNAARFEKRVASGRIRDCHGDLRTDHVYIRGETIDIVDGIEFNPAYRYGDVASDLAFLVMEIDELGRRDLSSFLFNEYLTQTADFGLVPLFDFYTIYRAMVRAKVALLRASETEVPEPDRLASKAEAEALFRLAEGYITSRAEPTLTITCGVSGSGKSTRARSFAARTGAVIVPSDSVRKDLAGLAPGQKAVAAFSEGIYTQEMSSRTYGAMLEHAQDFLQLGWKVILDATYPARPFRDEVRQMAARMNVPFGILWCDAPDEVLRKQIEGRTADAAEPSDATAAILARQRANFQPLDQEEQTLILKDPVDPSDSS